MNIEEAKDILKEVSTYVGDTNFEEELEAINTILSELDSKDKEIEELKKLLEKPKIDEYSYNKIYDENKQKDKVIELMADRIALDESVCELTTKYYCCSNFENKCIKCVINHFKNLAKEEK